MKLKTESPVKKEMDEDNTDNDDDDDDEESEDEWEDVEGINCIFFHVKYFLRSCISH